MKMFDNTIELEKNKTISIQLNTAIYTYSFTTEGKKDYLSTDFNMNGESDNVDKNDKWLENINKDTQVPD